MNKNLVRKIVQEEVAKKAALVKEQKKRHDAAKDLVRICEEIIEEKKTLQLVAEVSVGGYEIDEESALSDLYRAIPVSVKSMFADYIDNMPDATKDYAIEIMTGLILNATAEAVGFPVSTSTLFGQLVRNAVPKIVDAGGMHLVLSAIIDKDESSCRELVQVSFKTIAETAKESIFDEQIMKAFIGSFTEAFLGQRLELNNLTQLIAGIPRETTNKMIEDMLEPYIQPATELICGSGDFEEFKREIMRLATPEAGSQGAREASEEIANALSQEELVNFYRSLNREA